MAKDFNGTMHFRVGPEDLFSAQCDPEYVMWKHENMAAHDVAVDVTRTSASTVVRSSRELPAEVPAVAQKLVGSSIRVVEVHTWGAAQADGTRSGTVEASFPGAPMSVSGTLALRPDGTGAALDVAITCRASVPLVGGKLEQIVGEQFMRALAKEESIAPEWFDR